MRCCTGNALLPIDYRTLLENSTTNRSPMHYSRFGKLRTKPEERDAVVAILLRDVNALRDAGCHLYVVQTSESEAQAIWVTELWESKAVHRASLQLPAVKAAIAEAIPLLTGEFDSMEFDVVGGLGVPT